MVQRLELLAPAKNLECGMAAIDHGADAVYIGASRFGARAHATNSIADIKALCAYAHVYGAKVYATVNTIVYEDELEEVWHLMGQLSDAGVDAVLIQDMGLCTLSRWKELGKALPLHASTQTDNRSVEKVRWLHSLGFQRVVLARELSLEEIRAIHQAVPTVELEAFVHGALCVSYSGVCYASHHCFGRSANRGECAQFCRLKFDLLDADGKEIAHQRHFLSLKDLCQIDSLALMADAGVTSFKIEGRLKDLQYVKNVVSAYHQRLNELVEKEPSRYSRSSMGRVSYTFTPNLEKTFNRGYTNYFLKGRRPDIISFDTPKAMGEPVGKVKEVRARSFTVAGIAAFSNGDGLCFLDRNRELQGFRVNRVEGNCLFPQRIPVGLRPGTPLFRNHDVAFEKQLQGTTATRKIPVRMRLSLSESGFTLQASIKGMAAVASTLACAHEPALHSQRENIVRQLSKLGNTPYVCEQVEMEEGIDGFFIPSSTLAVMRREVVERLSEAVAKKEEAERSRMGMGLKEPAVAAGEQQVVWHPSYKEYPYLYNVANSQARSFYERQGLSVAQQAFECQEEAPSRSSGALLMQCRHCLRYALGFCVRNGGNKPTWREPLFLRLSDGRKFRLQFQCNFCQMNVYAE